MLEAHQLSKQGGIIKLFEGTSQGAIKGWETRRGMSGPQLDKTVEDRVAARGVKDSKVYLNDHVKETIRNPKLGERLYAAAAWMNGDRDDALSDMWDDRKNPSPGRAEIVKNARIKAEEEIKAIHEVSVQYHEKAGAPKRIYRGITEGQTVAKGASFWTSSKEMASQFAGEKGTVVGIDFDPKSVIYSSHALNVGKNYYSEVKKVSGIEDADEFLMYHKTQPKETYRGPGKKSGAWLRRDVVD